ncbi:MAG TPA: ABC transporter permease subunit [Pyrinomonadaceae bacterium]|jgi:ABC-type transport system involved in multi-copper enzyme maturation permease subunit|nr:ABC transporter permease subunit [Pyrinomonadaceae bacterium]
MAVYEHTYKQYLGQLTPEWSRFLVIPRHAFRDVFKSKIFTTFFIVCFLPLLLEAILIYLHHNVNALAILKVNVPELIPIDASFFQTFVNLQSGFAFFVALLVGPPLVARDLRNNALPLYLCRPFSRAEYVLGKMSVLLILLSAITWVPQLLLFLFQSYLEGASWFVENLTLASAIVISSMVWILLLALLTQAISALVKWRVVASAGLIGIFFIPSVFGEVVNGLFLTRWGHLISLGASMRNVTAGLFGTFVQASAHLTSFNRGVGREIILYEPPLWASWFVLFVACAICLALLSWKVKAYEVVR